VQPVPQSISPPLDFTAPEPMTLTINARFAIGAVGLAFAGEELALSPDWLAAETT